MFLASVKHFVIFILKCAIQSHLTADIIKNKKLTHVITNSNSFLSLATIFLTFKKKKAYHICPCQSTGLLPCFFCVYVCVCPTCQFMGKHQARRISRPVSTPNWSSHFFFIGTWKGVCHGSGAVGNYQVLAFHHQMSTVQEFGAPQRKLRRWKRLTLLFSISL